MLDMGFKDDIDFILEQVPADRQMSLFSATIDNSVMEISHQYMSNPDKILVSRDEIALPQITQLYAIVNPFDKISALNRIIETEKIKRAIIFCRTRIRSTKLAAKLRYYGHNAEAIHAGLSQAQRESIINAFRNHRINMLTATDVIARGIDIKDIPHILNYDVPLDSKVYFHRIGRTARVGKEGIAITLVGYNEISEFERIKTLTKTSIKEMEINSTTVLRGRRYENSSNRHIPVKIGEKYEADIIKTSRRGDGIAKIKGFVIFIPNTRIGDRARFKINQISRKYATAEEIY
jgi:ATP-dependent RNA helicase DeaD